jgi:protein TonB
MLGIQLGTALIGRVLKAPWNWTAAVARHSGGSLLRCRLAGVGVSLLVHTPLVWILPAVAPVPFPIEPGFDSIVAVSARRQTAPHASLEFADPQVDRVLHTESRKADAVQRRDGLSADMRAVGSVSAPAANHAPDVDTPVQRLFPKPVRRQPNHTAALVWPQRWAASELSPHGKLLAPERPTASPALVDGNDRVVAATEFTRPTQVSTATPDNDNTRIKHRGSTPQQTPQVATHSARSTRTRPVDLEKPEAPQPAAAPITKQPPPQPDAAEPDRAEQNRDSVASRQSSGQLLQRLPRKLPRNPQPIYPADAWRLGREGRVVLYVRVDIQGRVRDARVRSSSGTRSLDQAALEAVRRWKFRPALRGHRPVEQAVLVPVSFRIEH